MHDCRLIVEGDNEGALNMAVDEVLLRAAAEGKCSTLRFYAWKPATLSLGYFQEIADRSLHAASHDCDLVRRASGGGAILHDCELTYSFATPTESRLGGAEEMYLAFHETLVELLAEVGVMAKLHAASDGLIDDAFLCFQRRAIGDVTCDGFKIAGSAQRRWKNAILQHGSLLLTQSTYAPELPGLRELAGFDYSGDAIAENFIPKWLRKLASRLKVNFQPGELTDTEINEANTLCAAKFATLDWNARR